MKNLIVFFTVALFLVLTSCTKEELIQPETSTEEIKIASSKGTMPQAVITSESQEGEFTSINHLQVVKTSYSQVSGELLIGFTSNYDFTSKVLEDTQYMLFEDVYGNESTFALTVNSHEYSNDVLSVAFAVGGNNFVGLSLGHLQSIIIIDELIE